MKRLYFSLLAIFITLNVSSQLLTWTPAFPEEGSSPVTITLDATKGNQGLLAYTPVTDVYVHTGVITNKSTGASDWKYVKFNQNFNLPNPALQATNTSANKWQFTISGGLRAYYGITDPTEHIEKIAILFRNGNGSRVQRNTNGSDMYIPVFTNDLAVQFSDPFMQATFDPIPEAINKVVGDNISITGISNSSSDLKIYFNGTVIQNATGSTTITANPVISFAGEQVIVLEAISGAVTVKDTIKFVVLGSVVTEPLPPGVNEGINYESDQSAATLVLFAPNKNRVSVIGDLPGSNWIEQPQYQMKKTPDGNYWWLRLTGLTAGTEYAYQYYVDGALKIADPYTEKVLDPYHDGTIPASTYPSLKPYPTGLTEGIVSILQTNSAAYTWSNNSFSRPDKRNLMIYELLVRDMIAAHDWNTLRDTLNYIKNLGINTIELLPFSEFEGNSSWGYNPDFYFAPDKYYGPKNSLKRFIDSCHSKGIAVVMDIALNHSFGLSPMVQLYFDNTTNRPTSENPWFNPTPRHAFNVGYDMNHESLDTRRFVSRVVGHWLNEYKIDGFRFDLSKGFTQTQTCNNNGDNCDVNAWSNYDASRVAIWKRYYDTLQLKSAGSYAILEHFADNTEEKELSDYGMMFWGNLNYNFSEAAMGYVSNSNFDGALSTTRGWTNPYLVSYMESHDEERIVYKNVQFGNSSGSYNTKDLGTALKRVGMNAAFLFMMPGPKMIWQFGELGYDYSINHCQDGTVNNNCRTDPKPIRWDYLQNPNRKQLHDVFSSLLNLRYHPDYVSAFTGNNVERSLGGAFKWMKVNGAAGNIMVIGNFDVVPQTSQVTFQEAGLWRDHLTGATIDATGNAQTLTLQPGEYYVYLKDDSELPVQISLTGIVSQQSNVLNWKVTNEQGVQRYEIERSSNNTTFDLVATLDAAGTPAYSYTDAALPTAILYYRVKAVMQDGSVVYSNVIVINNPNQPAGTYLHVRQNPFSGGLNFRLGTFLSGRVNIIMTDAAGKIVLKKAVTVNSGSNEISIIEASALANGIYILKVQTSLNEYVQTVIKAN